MSSLASPLPFSGHIAVGVRCRKDANPAIQAAVELRKSLLIACDERGDKLRGIRGTSHHVMKNTKRCSLTPSTDCLTHGPAYRGIWPVQD